MRGNAMRGSAVTKALSTTRRERDALCQNRGLVGCVELHLGSAYDLAIFLWCSRGRCLGESSSGECAPETAGSACYYLSPGAAADLSQTSRCALPLTP